mgnify:CR=1 FL=1
MSTIDNNNTLLREQLGKGDIEVFTTAAQTSKDFYAINFPVESVITTITIANATGSGLNGITLPAGYTLFGRCTAIGYVENDGNISA